LTPKTPEYTLSLSIERKHFVGDRKLLDSLPAATTPAVLDPSFRPAALADRSFRHAAEASGSAVPIAVALEQDDGTVSRHDSVVFPDGHALAGANARFVERLVKCLLWARGGFRIHFSGPESLAGELRNHYARSATGRFDSDLIGGKVYGHPIEVIPCSGKDIPTAESKASPLGRHIEGCRIGFDLGGSDRKCAAVVDGKVVHSEEVEWNPYFQKDPRYHRDGIRDSLKRAADKLPRVDAIGGSSAGIYVNNQVRVASLFRGVPDALFESKVRRIFLDIKEEWGGVPFEVVNDGDVTALAGSMSMKANGVLGIAMGTSLAAGYVNAQGNITSWLSELAFVPIDYNPAAPVDEWSGDYGCGVQYLSQQAVGRLCAPAGIDLPAGMPLPEKLVEVQKLMRAGDKRARKIYETIGVYFGYAVAHYASFYDIRHVLVMGRVTSGEGGSIIIEQAGGVLKNDFPELAASISFHVPDEKDKRHGQAIAAASLPMLGR
jgi:predicted NBD/HSP70 family sugar kinase